MPEFLNLTNLLQVNSQLMLVIIAAVGILILAWLIFLTYLSMRSLKFTQSLFGDTHKEDLKEILQEHIGRVGSVQIRLNDLEKMHAQIDHKSKKHISKMGVVRFNPYEDTGGDQSFALALLDEADDGIVISSLHGRNRTRTYAKPVKSGDAIDYEFSLEEKEAIRKARAMGHK